MDYLPLFFDLKSQQALLVGGGEVAVRKARLLKRAGVNLTVVSHEVVDELRQMLTSPKDQIIIGDYHPSHLEEKCLVIAATDDNVLHERIHYDATTRQVPINVVDTPHW